MVYPWDQRQSVFDAMIDPDTKFEGVSGYNAEFVKKTNSWSRTIPSAGVKCYEGEIGDGPPNQVRRNYARKHFPDKANVETLTDNLINKENGHRSEEGHNSNYFYHDENSENNRPTTAPTSPRRTQTYTVLQDASNFNERNHNEQEQSSEALLRNQFADMGLSARQEESMKKFGRMVVEPGMDNPRRQGEGSSAAQNYFAQPTVINVSDN